MTMRHRHNRNHHYLFDETRMVQSRARLIGSRGGIKDGKTKDRISGNGDMLLYIE